MEVVGIWGFIVTTFLGGLGLLSFCLDCGCLGGAVVALEVYLSLYFFYNSTFLSFGVNLSYISVVIPDILELYRTIC